MNKVFEKKLNLQFTFTTFAQETSEDDNTIHPQLSQIHSSKIIPFEEDSHLAQADGWILAKNKITTDDELLIKTADCCPLFLESDQNIFFLHAGWRGLHDSIIQSAFDMDPRIHFAFLGPCINQEYYEVGAEFKDFFAKSSLHQDASGGLTLSLEKECHRQLKQNNPKIEFHSSHLCTFSHKELHSYRKDKTNMRNFNIISLKSLTN